MQFYNPTVTFKGSVICESAPSGNTDLVRKQDVSSLSYISAIASGSSSMLDVTNGELSISSLALTDVHVDNSQTSLANFISNESSTAASLKEGDVLVLTAPSDGTETYIVSGADGSSASNYTQIESPLTAAEVGSVIQAGDGISINSSTAQISANIAAGTGISSSVNSGQITLAINATSDQITEGSSNLFYTNARSRSALSAATVSAPEVQLLTYNSGTGALSVPLSSIYSEFAAGTGLSYSNGTYSINANTDQITEGSSNLYYTDARSRAALSAGTGIAYNSSTGAISANLTGGTAIGISGATISFNGSSDDVSEGSSNKYFTDARSRAAISAAAAGGGDVQLMTYNNSNGQMGVLRSSVFSEFSGGTAISFNAGVIAFNGSSDDVSEGSSNKYFTDARSRSAISAATVSAPEVQLLTYNSGTGALSVPLSSIYSEFAAGTGLSYSNGTYSINATSDQISEGSSNLFFTAARCRSAVTVSSQSDELLNYNNGTGEFSLRLQELRFETSVTLTANVASTITHNLGKQLVHVSAMDSGGNQIQVEVVYSSTSALTVKSAVGVTISLAVSV